MTKKTKLPPQKETLQNLLTIALVTLTHLFCNGYLFGAVDQHIYFAFITRALEAPAYHPQDLLFNYGNLLITSAGFFLQPLVRIFGWEWPLFILYIIVKFFIFYNIYYLALDLFEDAHAALLSLIFLLFNQLIAGTATDLHEAYIVYRLLALPLILCGFRQFLRKKFVLCALCLGIAFHFHVLSVLYFFPIMASIAAFNSKEFLSGNLRKLAKAAALFLLLSSPLILWKMFLHVPTTSAFDPSEWLATVRLAMPWLFISKWPVRYWWWIFFPFFIFLLYAQSSDGEKARRIILPFYLATFLMLGAHYACADLWPNLALLKYQWYRSLNFLVILGLILYARLASEILQSRQKIFFVLFSSLAMLEFAFGPPTFLYLLSGTLLLGLIIQDAKGRVQISGACLLVLLCLFLQFSYLPQLGTFDYHNKKNLIFQAVFLCTCAFFFTALAEEGRWPWLKRPAPRLALIALFCVNLWYFYMGRHDFSKNPFDETAKIIDFPGEARAHVPWFKMQLWVKEHTAPEAMFFTPPCVSGFRMFSARSPFVEARDGSLALLDPSFTRRWLERMNKLHAWPVRNYLIDYKRFYGIESEEWKNLSQEFGINYLITGNPNLPFRKLHEAPPYILYDLAGATDGEGKR